MKRGFLKSTKAYPKNTPASGGNIEPAKSQNGSHPLFYDMAAQSKKIGGLKRETVSIEGHIPKPLDYILKDTDQTDFEDSDWIIANLPSTADASEGRTACLVSGRARRRILNTPGYPQPLPRPVQPDCFSIEEIPGKGRGLVATKDIKWSDLIFAERPLIVHPAALPVNHESLILEGHFTGPQMQQIGLNEAERQLELLFAELSPQAQAAYKDLWNCHKEDGSGPILGISRTNGFGVNDYREPSKPGFPKTSNYYSGTWNYISRLNHSCRPNVTADWDSPSFSMQVRAVRDIKKGEELCLSYIPDLLKLAASRQSDLRSYGFECVCPACTNAALSDARCKEIKQVNRPQMMAVTDLNAMMKQQKESMERAIALMEVEGLQVAQEYGNLLSRMSQVCGAAQDREGARRYKKLYDTFVRATKSVKNSTIAKKEEGSKKLHEEMQQQMTEHMATMGYQAQQAWK